MIYAVLFLLSAAVLFGASRVIGAIGTVLGFLCAVIGLAVAGYAAAQAFEVTATQAVIGIVLGILAVILAYGVIMELRGYDPATGKKRR